MQFIPFKQESTASHAKDLDIILSSEKHVLILDDRKDVWSRHADNLIQVPYSRMSGGMLVEKRTCKICASPVVWAHRNMRCSQHWSQMILTNAC